MLEKNIGQYKRKYYLNKLIKGGIFALAIMLSTFLVFNAFEYFGNFNTPMRALLFYSFIITAFISLAAWVIEPLTRILLNKRQLSDHDAATRIGNHFPTIKDKLLNVLQLQSMAGDSDLIQASIAQKSEGFSQVQFAQAIDLTYNRRYLKYLLVPFILISGIFLFRKDFFTQSTTRIVNYNQTFEPSAPFDFKVLNADMTTFKNEDFELALETKGSEVPANAHIITSDGRRLKMSQLKTGQFGYVFKKMQKDVSFRFEASGFYSEAQKITVFSRPNLRSFSLFLDYPAYVGKKDERVNNTGNIIVPEGTKVTWQFQTQATETLNLKFKEDKEPIPATLGKDNTFEFSKRIRKSDNYEVVLENEYSKNKDAIEYYLNVVKDEHPSINLKQYEDTVLYDYLILGGNIGDDYGITALNLKYQILKEGEQLNESAYQTINIPFNVDIVNQSFFYKLELGDFKLDKGQRIEYFVEVWDNDGVNGKKRSKTTGYQFKVPNNEEIKEKLSAAAKQAEKQMDDVLKKSKDLNKDMKDLQDRLKGKRKMDWQDKKAIKDMVEKHKQLEKEVEKMQQENQLLNEKQNKFNQFDENLKNKAEQLQKLMDELLDEETKQMYDELNQLLEQNYLDKELLEKLQQLDQKQETLEMELDRSIELFKRLKFDMKAQKLANELKELGKEQEELSEETKEGDKKEDLEDVKEKQDELDKKFEEFEDEMKELDKMNEELKNPKDLDEYNTEQKDIKEQMKETQKQLGEQKKNKASDSQQKAGEKMQQMAQKMQEMQQSAEMQQLSENYDDLRQILENLIKLSFDEENLMKEFRKIRRIDPKFGELGQKQLKLKSDAQIIEDSLVALSKRVFQIESFVTREVTAMNNYIDEAIDIIRRRPPDVASAASSKQQFAMTSINNLALLLNDILKQMQQQMSSGMAGQQNNQKNQGNMSMSQLQKQLNQQIDQLKKSGKSGRQLSEELAKLAAQQEMIRRAMQQGSKGQKGEKSGKGGKGGKDGNEGDPNGMKGNKPGDKMGDKDGKGGQGGNKPLEQLMEETENDLVNKRITAETIKRQKEILTRLLQSEKANRERELDKEREAKTAKERKNEQSPADFSEYLKLKEKQIELLKTIPASLNPYYKKEVNEYFKKIEK
ncbi:MAG: DUF4175 family protein [Flammeovirgaceae bacterium]